MSRREEVSIAVPGGRRMPACLAIPDSPGPHPAVIVIHEIFGLNDDIRRIAGRFADEGYVALAPDLFFRGGKLRCAMRAMRDLRAGQGTSVRDADAAREWIAARDDVDASRIGVAGFCFGGGFALLYAVKAPVGATAPFYGAVPKETARLEGICPVVASFGGRDRPLAKHGPRLENHLRKLGVPHDVKVYEDAGHSFMSQFVPGPFMRAIGSKGPMKAGYVEEAAEDAWKRVLSFFSQHL
jgi:carboxymethylenebutenolidase